MPPRPAVASPRALCLLAALALAALHCLREGQRRRAARGELERRRAAKRREHRRQRERWSGCCRAPGPAPPALAEGPAALRERLWSGALRPSELARRAIHWACVIDAHYHCVTEQPFEEALDHASELDTAVREGDPPLLWGVPVTVKDSIEIRGRDSSCGALRRCHRPSPRDGAVARRLRRAGAVLVAKSNVPQVMMLPESDNRIWGKARNPWNPSRTAGGSTGGEGVLLATGVSALGVGTDIGGSLRIPALWCGVCGFLPTPGRLSHAGAVQVTAENGFSGNDIISASLGPMARRVEGLELGMRVLTAEDPLGAELERPPARGWDRGEYEGWCDRPRLRVGVYESAPFFELCPTARRAVQQAAAALRRAGHEVVELPARALPMGELAELYYGILSAEGGMRSYRAALGDEPLLEHYRSLRRMAGVPGALRAALAPLLPPRLGRLLRCTGGKSAAEFFALVARLKALRRELLRALFTAEDGECLHLDALVSPGPALPALPHGMSKDLTPSFCYTFLANLLRVPTAALPTCRVREDECTYDGGAHHRDRLSTLAAASLAGAAGLPMGVQVSTPPHTDERCLGVARQLERLHDPFGRPPPPPPKKQPPLE